MLRFQLSCEIVLNFAPTILSAHTRGTPAHGVYGADCSPPIMPRESRTRASRRTPPHQSLPRPEHYTRTHARTDHTANGVICDSRVRTRSTAPDKAARLWMLNNNNNNNNDQCQRPTLRRFSARTPWLLLSWAVCHQRFEHRVQSWASTAFCLWRWWWWWCYLVPDVLSTYRRLCFVPGIACGLPSTFVSGGYDGHGSETTLQRPWFFRQFWTRRNSGDYLLIMDAKSSNSVFLPPQITTRQSYIGYVVASRLPLLLRRQDLLQSHLCVRSSFMEILCSLFGWRIIYYIAPLVLTYNSCPR